MKRSAAFREQAAHCVRMAQLVPADERPLLLDMAQKWLNLADQADKNDNQPNPTMPAYIINAAELPDGEVDRE